MVKNRIDFINECDLCDTLKNSDVNITKLYLCYELKCRYQNHGYTIDIDFINELYQIYIDSDIMSILYFIDKFNEYVLIISYDFNDFDDFNFNDFIDFLDIDFLEG